jgi:integrase
VDFQRGFITIRNPKGKKSQTIPLNDSARAILESHPRIADYVFVSRNGGPFSDARRRIDTLRKAAGLPEGFRPMHGLRHVYASMLASSGQVDLYALQRLLTHKSPEMTQRYAHLRDQALRRASNLAGEIVEAAKEK